MEIWDLYDQNECFLHKTHVRGVPLKDDEYHLVVQIWTFSNHQLLVTLRHEDKPYGLKWEVTGGSVLANESPLEGAVRELKEETGIICDPEELYLSCTKIEGSAIYKSYILVKECSLDMIRCQENETIDARFVSFEQWQEMLKNDLVAKPIRRHYEKYHDLIDGYFEKED